MSKRAQGDALERYVRDSLNHHGLSAHQTAGSGAVRGDGDVMSKSCAFECKTQHERRGKVVTSPTIDINEFEKIEYEAIRVGKQPVLVIENGRRQRFAVMDLDQFIQIIAKVEHGEESEG